MPAVEDEIRDRRRALFAGWARRHPHQATALASAGFALAVAALVLAAGRSPAAALVPVVAAAVFVWCELFSLALGKPLVLAILDRPRGRGRVLPRGEDGSGLDGPDWDRGGELLDAGAFAGDGGGGGGDGGGGG